MIDLGHAPPSNAYLTAQALAAPEVTYPLRVLVCDGCLLVQTEDFTAANELFDDSYAYLSSTSKSWVEHAARYSRTIVGRLGLGSHSHVIEVACNDGYLLRNFVAAGIPCLGIEPTASTASRAEACGIPVLREFFGETLGRRLATSGRTADLVIGNNVLAHVPDINDFTRGLAAVLAPQGVVTLEFPHVMRLLEFNQFDTIYHEHFSYLSLMVLEKIFAATDLRIFDVEELPTHGGSLRLYCCHARAAHPTRPSVAAVLRAERERGLGRAEAYTSLQSRAEDAKNALLSFLIDARRRGRSVAAYGAAAKGNTLLNFAGIRSDLLPFVCDAAPSKQGKYLPGSHIPIRHPDAIFRSPPDFVLILPWNIGAEIKAQLAPLATAGTRFVTAIPELAIH